MSYCKDCGTEIPEGATFCPSCGKKVEVDPWGTPASKENTQNNTAQENATQTAAADPWGTPANKVNTQNNTQNNSTQNNNTEYTQNTQQANKPYVEDSYSVLSILGLVFIFVLSPFIGLIVSIVAFNDAKKNNSAKSKSLSKAGIIVAAVLLGLSVLAVLVYVIVYVVIIVGSGALVGLASTAALSALVI
ncbi:MAG: zinc-ribbon domain-containing protein [Candidatus Coproplasma sp.]